MTRGGAVQLMRVLFVTDWPGRGGGVESHIALLTDELRARGDKVRLLTSAAGDGRAHGSYVAYAATHPLPQAALQVANPFAARAARRAVAEFRPDVAHVSMFEMHLSPAVVEALRGVPTILSIAYYKPVCPNGLKLLPDDSLCTVEQGAVCWRGGCVGLAHWLRDRPRYALIQRAVRRAAAILTCSAFVQRELARAGIEAAFAPWPTRLPSPEFRRAPAREPLFVFTGRLAREKGVDTLLRALALVHARGTAARVRIVGDGPLRPQLEALAASLGVAPSVEWAGWVDPAMVEPHLADAWALVAPSRWAEPLGLSAVEAIVRGVPVIASSVGGFAETVRDGVAGRLVPNGDVAKLADALAETAARPAEQLAVPAAEVARMRREHDPGRHLAWLREQFERVLDRGRA